MQLPLSWLKSLFPYDLSSKIIDDTLTKAGIEVDAVEAYNPPFSGVVCAKVESVQKHPDATKLQIASVFDGSKHYQVVCGAANCRAGLYVAFAKPGAVLGITDPMEIGARAVRGVHSEGMLCSLDELGLIEDRQPGIVELDDSIPLGTDLKTALSDEIFHISITPNLGHTLSVLGIARELSAFLKLPYKLESVALKKPAQLESLPIEINSSQCLAYCAYKLTQITSLKTPFIIEHRLRLSGQNPKNLVVDVLNYVMLERGQPMHGFDAARLHQDSLKVFNIHEHTPFHALNGKTYNLEKDLLAISSGHHIAALAGVMGSIDTSCTENTTSVILESAYFTPQAVRKSIKSLDLRTDAANRFEKGIDQAHIQSNLDYAASLIMHFGGAHLAGQFHYAPKASLKTLTLRTSRTNKLLGTHLTQNEMAEMLKRLEMSCAMHDSDVIQVTRPSYRNDINIEEDLMEEIGRLYGLDHLQGHLSYQATSLLDNPLYTFEKPLKKALFTAGLQEILTCDLLSKELVLDFKLDKGDQATPISVLHPRSSDQCTLRMSLLSSFIPVVKKNLSNKENDLAVFEVGKIHAKTSKGFIEALQAGLLISGSSAPYYFNPKPQDFDFYDLKGIVENVLDDVGIQDYVMKISHDAVFHPYQQLEIYKNGDLIGMMGQVHPTLLKKYDIDQKVFYAEFSIHALMQHRKSIYPVKLAPTQPYIERDWTCPLPLDQSFALLEHTLKHEKPEFMESVCLLDIYPQDGIKNVTVRIRYRHPEKSLESAYIDQIHQNFISDVAKKLGLSL